MLSALAAEHLAECLGRGQPASQCAEYVEQDREHDGEECEPSHHAAPDLRRIYFRRRRATLLMPGAEAAFACGPQATLAARSQVQAKAVRARLGPGRSNLDRDQVAGSRQLAVNAAAGVARRIATRGSWLLKIVATRRGIING
jgi:hypothetical protein